MIIFESNIPYAHIHMRIVTKTKSTILVFNQYRRFVDLALDKLNKDKKPKIYCGAMESSQSINQIHSIESDAVASFLKTVNNVIRGDGSSNPMSQKTALKFLISRKFDIDRALQLYRMHEITRLREGLSSIDANDPDLKEELESGKFTILQHRDPNDSAIAIFTAKLHNPNKSSKNSSKKKTTHQTTLQGIVYQLDAALDDIVTQRNGLVFIYNMSDSDYSNFDYELCQKILNLLKGAYPAKLKRVLIVSPPIWFRGIFHLLRLVVREKLRDRIWLLNIDQLSEHIPPHALTPELGGSCQHNHLAWLSECNNLYKVRYDDLCDPTSAHALVQSSNKLGSRLKLSSSDHSFGSLTETDLNDSEADTMASKLKPRRGVGYDYDDGGMTLNQFVRILRDDGLSGLAQEYNSIVSNDKEGTFMVSCSNMRKNRYTNILCYDHSRVVLELYDLPEGVSNTYEPMDYINANFVDGYRQPKAYISTQGPTHLTFNDFWRMIWQTGSRVIVMVTLNIENDRLKCEQYWPSFEDRKMEAGVYTIEFISLETHDDFVVTQLRLTNNRSEVSRDIWHLQFISWPDFGTPETATALLKYRESVLKKQLEAMEAAGSLIKDVGSSAYPPITVHCSAGVGRSGTFIAIDISIQKLETTGLIDMKGVVEKLREQRYSSIQTKEQYMFCYKSVFEFAVGCGLLNSEDTEGLFV